MIGKRKQNLSIQRRVGQNVLLLLAVIVMGIGLLLYPGWRVEHDVREWMREDGLTGAGPIYWRGQAEGIGDAKEMLVLVENGHIYTSRLEFYEQVAWIRMVSGILPEGITVTNLIGDEAWHGNEEHTNQLVALNLPEEAAVGRLLVRHPRGGRYKVGAVRGLDGVRDGNLMLFPTTMEAVTKEENALVVPYEEDDPAFESNFTLLHAPYTLILRDERGHIVSTTSGRLESIWTKGG